MNTVNLVIVLEWLFTLVGAMTFLALYGRPWKYVDKVMSWHLASVTAVAGLEVVGLLMVGWSLVPSAIAYGLATAIIYWRLFLLLAAQRRARREQRCPRSDPTEAKSPNAGKPEDPSGSS